MLGLPISLGLPKGDGFAVLLDEPQRLLVAGSGANFGPWPRRRLNQQLCQGLQVAQAV